VRSHSARAVAVDALVRVEAGGFSHILVPGVLRGTFLDPRDRAFVTDLVYGTLRAQRALDYLLAGCVDRSLDALDAPVRAALRLGAYQLVSGVSPHAAVGETVAATPERARGLVNAVLRRLSAAGPPWPLPDGDDTRSLGLRLSYPDWLVERLVADLGREDALATLAAGNAPARVALRPNRGRGSAEALARELRAGGASVEEGMLIDGALTVRGLGDPARAAAVAEGRATPQDEASQAVVAAVAPEPGDRVLDVAAGPGGKSTGLGELVGESGAVVAVDAHPGRLRLVADAAARLGLGNLRPVLADGRALPTRRAAFDRVLVDAPCSGLGALRRRPEARWRIRTDDVIALAALQRALLRAAAGAVRPGGVLVFSVCTLTRDETLGVDEWAAAELPDLVALAVPGPRWRRWGRGALLLPHDAGTDGMFVLRLQRDPAAAGR
jgi:16S rRNA (cytosine967-C5)-methyltransferase